MSTDEENESSAPLLADPSSPHYGGTAARGSSTPAPRQVSFKRNLGAIEAFGIIISIVIGSGIFTSPGAIDSNVPSPGAALVVWLVGGILAWTGATTMAELGTAIPGEGGVQPYLQYIFGDIFGFLAAWTWIIAVMPATLAILSIVFVESIYSAAGITDQSDSALHKLLSVLVLLAISVANSISTKVSTRLNGVFVTTKFLAILAVVIAGITVVLRYVASHPDDATPPEWLRRSWFRARKTVGPDGSELDWNAVSQWELLGHYSAALYGALWAYSGWDKAIYITAELSAPARQLPLAVNTAIPTIILSFLAVNAAYYILVPWDVIPTTDSVAVTAFGRLLGPGVAVVAAVMVCLVVAGSLLGNSFVVGRMIVAAANSNWLPGFLANVGRAGFQGDLPSDSGQQPSNFDAPINAIILSTACPIPYIVLGNFRALLTFNGLAEYTFFFLTVIGAIVLRYREPALNRPYKPLVLIPVVFAAVSGFVVIRGAIFAPLQILVLIILWLIGLAFYHVKGRLEADQGH